MWEIQNFISKNVYSICAEIQKHMIKTGTKKQMNQVACVVFLIFIYYVLKEIIKFSYFFFLNKSSYLYKEKLITGPHFGVVPSSPNTPKSFRTKKAANASKTTKLI